MAFQTKNGQNNVAVFDLDGTLLDSGGKLEEDVIEAMNRLGIQITPKEAHGDWYALAEKHGISKEEFDYSFDQRKSWKESMKTGKVTVFPDTYSCLTRLKNSGVRLGLLSRSLPEYTKEKLDFFNLKQYFDSIRTVGPQARSKADGAAAVIDDLNPHTISKVYFIGDKEEDVAIAQNIKERFKLNAQGVYIKRDNTPDLTGYRIVKTLDELPEIVRK